MTGSEGWLRAAAIGVTVTCGLTLAVTGALLFAPDVRGRLSPATPPAYVPGTVVDVPAETYAARPHTLLIFSRSDCGACLGAVPVLERVVRELRDTGEFEVSLIARLATPEDELAYAERLGIPPSHVFPQDLDSLRVERVPTLLVVDASGSIRFAQEGAPTDEEVRSFVDGVLAASADD